MHVFVLMRIANTFPIPNLINGPPLGGGGGGGDGYLK
jgi:hypothetical protein